MASTYQLSPATHTQIHSENHVLHTRFCQNHQQKRVKPPEKITAKAFLFPVGSWLLQAG